MCDSFLISRTYRIYPREESDHPTNKLDRLQKKRNGATWRWNILKYTESNSHPSVLIYHVPQCRAMSIWCKRLQKYLKKCKSYVNMIKHDIKTGDCSWSEVTLRFNILQFKTTIPTVRTRFAAFIPMMSKANLLLRCFSMFSHNSQPRQQPAFGWIDGSSGGPGRGRPTIFTLSKYVKMCDEIL